MRSLTKPSMNRLLGKRPRFVPPAEAAAGVFRTKRISCSQSRDPFHIDDIVRAFSRSALDKGFAYQREGRARVVGRSANGRTLFGAVRGSQRLLYNLAVSVTPRSEASGDTVNRFERGEQLPRKVRWNQNRQPLGLALLYHGRHMHSHDQECITYLDQNRRARIAARSIAIMPQQPTAEREHGAALVLGQDVRLVLAVACVNELCALRSPGALLAGHYR